MQQSSDRPWRNFYGRRQGKALRPGQVLHMEETLPALSLPGVTWEDNPDRTPLDLAQVFGRKAPRTLEIGFGSGEHLLAQATAEPDADFLGCEPFLNGVAALVPRIDKAGLTNVRLHQGDARDLLDVLPDQALTRLYLLYPDPWPKKKHHRRRFLQPETLGPIARVLRPGGVLKIATDIPDYARHSLEQVLPHPAFRWTAQTPADWRRPWAGWTSTRYEQKALKAGRAPIYLVFERRG